MGWCQLRRLAIHPDLAADLWCHHWTAPTLHLPQPDDGVPLQQARHDRQLALAGLLS